MEQANKPRIVTIGGGSGQSQLLRYLKNYFSEITAIVSMVDDGGSTGELRSKYGVLPPGDLRRCIAALSKDEQFASIFEHRFEEGSLPGHAAGNIFISCYEQGVGNIAQAVDLLCGVANCTGTVIPVTNQLGTLHAELTDGNTIIGETYIDKPAESGRAAIKRVYLDNELEASPEAIVAIEQADIIILTIGDVYTSIIPNLLIKDIPEAIGRSGAKVLYTANRLTKIGETDGFSVLDAVQQLESYMGDARITGVVVDPTPAKEQHAFTYNKAELEQHGVECIEGAVLSDDKTIVNGERLASVVAEYINSVTR